MSAEAWNWQARIGALKAEVDDAQSKQEDAQRRVQALNESMSEALTNLDSNLHNNLLRTQRRCDALEAELAAQQTKANDMYTDLQVQRTNAAKLEPLQQQLDRVKTEHVHDKAALAERCSKLTSELDESKAAFKAADVKRQGVEIRCAELQHDLNSERARANGLTQQLDELKEQHLWQSYLSIGMWHLLLSCLECFVYCKAGLPQQWLNLLLFSWLNFLEFGGSVGRCLFLWMVLLVDDVSDCSAAQCTDCCQSCSRFIWHSIHRANPNHATASATGAAQDVGALERARPNPTKRQPHCPLSQSMPNCLQTPHP